MKQLAAIGIVIATPNQGPNERRFCISAADAAIMVEINMAQTEWVNDLAKGVGEGAIFVAFRFSETMRERLDTLSG
ncbi:hypothetical protein [Erythrobacter sp. Alg231-14]|uniref:hypothetical protein n=1 Tax=Erythrobacter sp. Alg231-14 TaxID=1922225 RepID=UPI000D55D550